MPDSDAHGRADVGLIHQPVHLPRNYPSAQQLLTWSDNNRSRIGPDSNDIHRACISARKAAPLPNRVAGVTFVRSYDGAVGRHDRPGTERWRGNPELPLEDSRVITVGHEADFLALRLLGNDSQSEHVRRRANFGLRRLAYRKQHSRENRAIDSPEKIGLVLVVVAAAIEHTIVHASVVAGCQPLGVYRIGLAQQIPELREGVAAHAWYGSAPAGVLLREILDDVVIELRLEVEHVVRNPKVLANASRVIHRVEGAARSIRYFVALAEQLHRRAYHVVAGTYEQCGGDGRIHASRHRNKHALLHRSACGAELPRLLNESRKDFRDAGNGVVGRQSAEAHSNRGASELGSDSHCHEHVRRADASARASRPARCSDTLEVERHEERLAVGAWYG